MVDALSTSIYYSANKWDFIKYNEDLLKHNNTKTEAHSPLATVMISSVACSLWETPLYHRGVGGRIAFDVIGLIYQKGSRDSEGLRHL